MTFDLGGTLAKLFDLTLTPEKVIVLIGALFIASTLMTGIVNRRL